jgi:hypothetical protein
MNNDEWAVHTDTGYFIALKMVIEQLFGKSAWYELKETTSVTVWRRYLKRTVLALEIAIEETVHADESWHKEASELLKKCEESLCSAKTFDHLVSSFTATLLRLTFLQIGQIPNHSRQEKVSLHKSNWKLDSYRTVIYAQKLTQRAKLFWIKQQRQIGFDAQMELYHEHRRSGSPLNYEDWCNRRTTKNDAGAADRCSDDRTTQH